MARRRREANAAAATAAASEARSSDLPGFLRRTEVEAESTGPKPDVASGPVDADTDTDTDVVDAEILDAEPIADADPADVADVEPVVAPDDLGARLDSLQAMVERLVAAQVTAEVSSGDPEVDSASRTLRFAQQTADSVIAEAREDALAIVADAERQRSEIIRRARQQADQDYAAERDEVMAASAAWQAQRDAVLEQLDALTTVFGRYRDGLSDLGATVDAIGAQLRTGIAAAPIAVAPALLPGEPEAAEGPGPDSADDDAATDPVVEAVGDATDDEDVVDLTRRNPFSASPTTKLHVVEADTDPFVFDVAELPETTGDFGWETDPVDGTDGATTF